MAELLRGHAEARPDQAALTDERGVTTWSELNARVDRLAGALRGLGLTTGDAIAIHSGNRREYFELMAAAGHIGLRYVLVNWHWTAEELAYVLADAGVSALFSEADFAAVAAEAAGRAPVRAFAVGGDIPGFTPYEEFLAGGPDAEPGDQCMGVPMIYTSGTTGRPKGVTRKLMTAGAPLEIARMVGDLFAQVLLIPPAGRSLLVGPVYHSAQWLFSHALLNAGRSVVMRRSFDAAETLRLIDEHAITNVHLVPTQFVRLLRLPERVRAAFDGSSLAAVWHGAAPCPPEVKRRMIDWFGPVVHEYYGSTEASVNTIITAREWLQRPGSVGRPLPTTQVHVLREDGTPAAPGEHGRLWFRYTSGDDVEYWGDEAKTASVHRPDGLFTTGDIGYFDSDGYLFLADRAIDMIISGGVNIYPAEIEGVLITHPAVADVAVFGVPDEEYGESVKAAVELTSGSTPSPRLAEELIAHCRASLAGYKAPRSIDFLDELPRTPTGKLYKRLLRDPYWKDHERAI
ncbi:long-chain acyl-CoA synthetase [Thermomonospora echinospora]|uniref:Long-chain acyl-CoA synthetase n=1 Tax=Thermomonospora echinospora TaxID=1992 RepID=A0A1H6DGT4_9ACTN|nr:AMP-binding protein [Thermomonospora echinospora]SEG84588.1 long-chain acyl-CoA synthetase [Thermomonospora echinospora]